MQRRIRFSLLLGNIFHHYETSLFGWVAPFLSSLLFPDKSGTEALLLTFAFLPLSYLSKPLGAFFWGWMGDLFGRKPVLVATLFGMALSTCAIGCLPLIPKAWMMLAICRLLQGFFSAGEEKGAALFLLEHTTESKRVWASALYDASGIAGILLASLLASYWGGSHWRLLFWFAGITAFFAAFFRKNGEESPEYHPTQFSWKIFWHEKFALTQIIIVSGFSYANYFLVSIFLNGFLPQITDLTKQDVLLLNTHLLWIDFLLLLGFGFLCRWIKKEYLMSMGAFLAAMLAIPLFLQLEGANWLQAAMVRISLVVFGVALAAPYHAWKMEILPKHNRFLIGSVGSAIGAKFLGAPVPLFSTWIVAQTGQIWTAALPIVVLGIAAGAILLQSRVLAAMRLAPIKNS